MVFKLSLRINPLFCMFPFSLSFLDHPLAESSYACVFSGVEFLSIIAGWYAIRCDQLSWIYLGKDIMLFDAICIKIIITPFDSIHEWKKEFKKRNKAHIQLSVFHPNINSAICTFVTVKKKYSDPFLDILIQMTPIIFIQFVQSIIIIKVLTSKQHNVEVVFSTYEKYHCCCCCFIFILNYFWMHYIVPFTHSSIRYGVWLIDLLFHELWNCFLHLSKNAIRSFPLNSTFYCFYIFIIYLEFAWKETLRKQLCCDRICDWNKIPAIYIKSPIYWYFVLV